MALTTDLSPGDIVVVPPDSGAKITIVEKSGRKTKLSVESAKPVQILRAKDAPPEPSIGRPMANSGSPLFNRPRR